MNSEEKITKGNVALKAGAWYVISSITVKMISIITTPMFTRLLSTDEYGTVATFSSWFTMFLVIYGLNLTVSIGRAKIDYPDKLDDYIGSMQTLSLFVSLGISAVIAIFIDPVSKILDLSKTATILLILYLIAGPTINIYQCGFRYKYQYKQNIFIAWYTALSTVVVSLVLIICCDGDKAIYRMFGITFPTVVLSLYFWFRTVKERHLNFNIEFWKYGLAISLPMILHAISMNILSQSDRIVISKYWGATPVAYYSLVCNYALLILIVTNAINQAWQPWFHDNYHIGNKDGIRKNTKLFVVLTCYIGLACIAIGPEAIYVLGGKNYTTAASCLPPMVLGVICQSTYTHYINLELHVKKTKYASQGTVLAAAINIVLNQIFVPMFSYVAAAATTFVSYFILLIVHYIITSKILKIKLYDNKFMFGVIAVTSLAAGIVYLTYQNALLRYIVLMVGLLSFVFVFRSFIISYVKSKLA